MQKILDRYNAQRITSDSFGGLADRSLKLADEQDLAWNYVASGILAMNNGDIEAALDAFQKGAEVEPSADAPHHFLVQAYYRLAFFNAVDQS